MHHPGGVHRDQRVGQPAGQAGERLPVQRAVLGHDVVEGAAGTNRVTMYGLSPSRSASITSATFGLRIRCMVSTSRASRRRAVGSPATLERST